MFEYRSIGRMADGDENAVALDLAHAAVDRRFEFGAFDLFAVAGNFFDRAVPFHCNFRVFNARSTMILLARKLSRRWINVTLVQ